MTTAEQTYQESKAKSEAARNALLDMVHGLAGSIDIARRIKLIEAVFELERTAHNAGIDHLNANLDNLKGGR